MGARVYLMKSSKGAVTDLFEANNEIPFFWYTLLSVESIENVEEEFRRVWNLDENAYNEYLENGLMTTNIKVSKPEFLENIQNSKEYISKNIPEKLNLFVDFTRYLEQKLEDEGILELALFEVADFDGVENFIKKLKREINTIRKGNKSKKNFVDNDFLLVGYDRFLDDEFKNYSADYSICCEKEIKEKQAKDAAQKGKERKSKTKRIIERIFMSIVSLIMILYGIMVIIAEGVEFFSVASIIGGGIILYFWGFRK